MTNLSKLRGLGSIKSGSESWFYQKLSAVIVFVTSIWIIFSFLPVVMTGSSYEISIYFYDSLNAFIIGLFLVVGFWHGKLGLQVVIEDYVHNDRVKILLIITLYSAWILLSSLTFFLLIY